jgi:hypothetical protein
MVRLLVPVRGVHRRRLAIQADALRVAVDALRTSRPPREPARARPGCAGPSRRARRRRRAASRASPPHLVSRDRRARRGRAHRMPPVGRSACTRELRTCAWYPTASRTAFIASSWMRELPSIGVGRSPQDQHTPRGRGAQRGRPERWLLWSASPAAADVATTTMRVHPCRDPERQGWPAYAGRPPKCEAQPDSRTSRISLGSWASTSSISPPLTWRRSTRVAAAATRAASSVPESWARSAKRARNVSRSRIFSG